MASLDDLPAYSDWPARLLGLSSWAPKIRTAEENEREYDRDKWGPILDSALQNPSLTLREIEAMESPEAKSTLCWIRGEFKILSLSAARGNYLNLVAEKLKEIWNSEPIVELGAGYGSVLLNLAKSSAFCGARFSAREYTESGVHLIRVLASREELSVDVGRCDFSATPLASEIEPNAIIFTSFAACSVPVLGPAFVRNLISLRPKAVVHFEPLYEHAVGASMLSLLRKRYIEVNDYNRDLLTILREAEVGGDIQICSETEPVFGANPLLAASVVVWKPVFGVVADQDDVT
jgi:hypothetical protein